MHSSLLLLFFSQLVLFEVFIVPLLIFLVGFEPEQSNFVAHHDDFEQNFANGVNMSIFDLPNILDIFFDLLTSLLGCGLVHIVLLCSVHLTFNIRLNRLATLKAATRSILYSQCLGIIIVKQCFLVFVLRPF
jgi:hypothetical protein